MMIVKRVKVDLTWKGLSEMVFIEHIELPPTVTQREFLEFCIETVERLKQLGTAQTKE